MFVRAGRVSIGLLGDGFRKALTDGQSTIQIGRSFFAIPRIASLAFSWDKKRFSAAKSNFFRDCCPLPIWEMYFDGLNVIHMPPSISEQRRDPTIAVSTILPGQLDNIRHQSLFAVRLGQLGVV